MPRRFTKSEEQLRGDPMYNDKVLSRFINCIMHAGKKAVAQRVVYGAFNEIEKRTKGDAKGFDVFCKALDNVKPEVEVRSKRVGGAAYQVPMQVSRNRQQSLAFRWLLIAVRDKKGRPTHLKLADELFAA